MLKFLCDKCESVVETEETIELSELIRPDVKCDIQIGIHIYGISQFESKNFSNPVICPSCLKELINKGLDALIDG